MGAITSFGGKPAGAFHAPADGKWYRVDIDVDDPTKSGLEIQEVYLHCDCTWKEPDSALWNALAATPLAPLLDKLKWWLTPAGEIRVRYTRESGDHTAYQDFTVASRKQDFLITHNHSERGQAEQGGRWWVQVKGGLAAINITTRYAKTGTAY